MVGRTSDIATLKDLKGKKVAIWPGSTQEVFILERLRMEGMTRSMTSQPIQAPASPRCTRPWRAATSTPMSAPSQAQGCRSARAWAAVSEASVFHADTASMRSWPPTTTTS